MKVSIFVHELSGNPIVRAYPIIKAIQLLGHEVEVLGLTYNTDKIYEPYKNEFEFKTIRSYLDIRWVVKNSRKLARLATGDVVYAFKPLWDSFYPALIYSRMGIKKRLILDAEDNELWDTFIGNGWKDIFKSKYYPINPIFNKLLHPFTFFVKRKTVACTNLQKRYGGIIVLHGPEASRFNPDHYASTESLRIKYKLPLDKHLVLFAGKSVYYNGLATIADTLVIDKTANWELVLAGDPNSPAFADAKQKLGDRCHLLGFVPNAQMPEVIKLCDVAPVLQTPIPSTEYQIPAKMLEAMAMGKGIVTTDVSDMKKIIGTENGWIIPFNQPEDLASLLVGIEQDPELLIQKGKSARKYFLDNASIEQIAERIQPFFEGIQRKQRK